MKPARIVVVQHFALLLALLLVSPIHAGAQAVRVSLKLDQAQIAVGDVTTLHVFAQLALSAQAEGDRIFSWYLDLLNLNGITVSGDYNALRRPASDNNPQTSSTGVTDGANRLGIYDTFLNLPAAGRDGPVELFSVPLKGLAPGRATLRIRPGTGVPLLSADFLVATAGDAEPLVGGDYSTASIDLEVAEAGPTCLLSVRVERSDSAPQERAVTILFQPCVGQNHVVEYAETLGGIWQPLPGAPHNSGSITDRLSSATRFYRVRMGN